MATIVPDASTVAAALVPSQYLPEAERLLESGSLRAPTLLQAEFYNIVFRLERRAIHPPATSAATLAEFDALDIEFVDDPSWAARALQLARRHLHAHIYDAIYLLCAEDLDAELWTCDARFVRSFGSQRPARLKLCPDDSP